MAVSAFENPRNLETQHSHITAITNRLKPLGFLTLFIFFVAILNFFIILYVNYMHINYFFVAISFHFISMVCAFFFENIVKKGNNIFSKISDEMQMISKQMSSDDLTRFRGALRAFTQATDLPLIPGRFGPAIYIGINIVAIGVEIFVFSLHRS
jgi:hypothetical protein